MTEETPETDPVPADLPDPEPPTAPPHIEYELGEWIVVTVEHRLKGQREDFPVGTKALVVGPTDDAGDVEIVRATKRPRKRTTSAIFPADALTRDLTWVSLADEAAMRAIGDEVLSLTGSMVGREACRTILSKIDEARGVEVAP